MHQTGKKDYYEVLGVSRDADEKQLKSAYRRLARKYHPDVNQGDSSAEDKFKEVSEAFAVLSDPKKRAQYDGGGHAAFGSGFDPFAGFDARAAGVGDLGDLLGNIFGGSFGGGGGFRGGYGGQRVVRPRQGNDLQLELSIDFMEAVRGTTLKVRVPRRGAGSQRQEDTVNFRVPVGIKEGARLRVAGKGDAGSHGGANGDLYLKISIRPHPMFRREGNALVCDLPVGIVTATLGGQVNVPTLDGSTKIQIPAGTRSGQRIRLANAGVPASGGKPAGDLFAVVQIQPPKKIDKKTREALEQLRDQIEPDA